MAAAAAAVAAVAVDLVDLAFAVQGGPLQRAHAAPLARALAAALPWLGAEPHAALHRLNVAAGGGPLALLSGRTRLTLRLPRARTADAAAGLCGASLSVAGATLQVSGEPPREREPLAFAAQYAHFVAAAAAVAAHALPADSLVDASRGEAADGATTAADAQARAELAFLAWVEGELRGLGVVGRAICGRRQTLMPGDGAAAVAGYGLMVDGLSREGARRLLERGLGGHRLWGCGVFVPHKSAAAVGAPDRD